MFRLLPAFAFAMAIAAPVAAKPACEIPKAEGGQLPSNIVVQGALRSAYVSASELMAAEGESCSCPFIQSWDAFMHSQFPDRDVSAITPVEAREIANAWSRRQREASETYSAFYRRACM